MSAIDPFAPDVCEMCEREIKLGKRSALYGQDVCKKCRDSFVMRRELAFLIDWSIVSYGSMFLLALLGLGRDANGKLPTGFWTPHGTYWLIAFAIGMTLKDSFRGVSLGKLITGLRVIDVETSAGIGPRQSFKRNLIVLIPLMPVFLAFQMRGGKRIGEGWANTRVILRKYAHRPIFGVARTGPVSWGSR